MDTATIFDTECTGLEAPEVIQLAAMDASGAWSVDSDVILTHFRPTKPITLGALAVHHILEEDLVDYPVWPGKWFPPTQYVVGHNVDFDWKAIGSPPEVKRICTLAMARTLYPDLDAHNLVAVAYHAGPRYGWSRHAVRELARNAHDAVADVRLTAMILHCMLHDLAVIDHGADHVRRWDELWEFSERARVPLKFTFGKYRGELISEIRREDPRYINWCLGVPDFANDPYLYKALTGRDLVARDPYDQDEDEEAFG